MGATAILVIVGIVLGAGIIVLLREVACWYFKINRITKLLEEISAKLGASAAAATYREAPAIARESSPAPVTGNVSSGPRPD